MKTQKPSYTIIMMEFKPYKYQLFGIKHILKLTHAGVFLDMGLGKTVISLTALKELLETFMITKPLIIAPKRVCETVWVEETQKWNHLKSMKGVKVLGSQKQRIAALNTDADFWVINRENVAWLVSYYKSKFPFDALIIDELSSFKSSQSQRFRSLKMIQPKLTRVIGLTGTPAPNGLIDLWSQMYLLDRGQRLCEHITEFRRIYFDIAKMSDHIVYKYSLKKDAAKVIYKKIDDICISMKAKDYLDLPKRIDNVIKLEMTSEVEKLYEQFERDQVMWLKEQGKITAANRAVLVGKLLQFSNGAIYDEHKKYHEIHDIKLEALCEIVEEAQGEPMLIAYSYKHDIERIKKRLKIRELKGQSDVDDWNKGKVPLMAAHPASAGHGINLQYGGHLLTWFGCNWSLELTEQFNHRVDRQGQTKAVIMNRLIMKGTMDEDVLRSLNGKDKAQSLLMEAIKARINKYF